MMLLRLRQQALGLTKDACLPRAASCVARSSTAAASDGNKSSMLQPLSLRGGTAEREEKQP